MLSSTQEYGPEPVCHGSLAGLLSSDIKRNSVFGGARGKSGSEVDAFAGGIMLNVVAAWSKPMNIVDGSRENRIYDVPGMGEVPAKAGEYLFARIFGDHIVQMNIGETKNLAVRLAPPHNSPVDSLQRRLFRNRRTGRRRAGTLEGPLPADANARSRAAFMAGGARFLASRFRAPFSHCGALRQKLTCWSDHVLGVI